MLGTLSANLRRMDVPLPEIRYALATHYHMDHAGLGRELKEAGVPLLVMETQLAGTQEPKPESKDGIFRVGPLGNTCISFEESRAFLAGIGLNGQILPTPGHSDDSVSLLLDDGSVFTGDLTSPNLLGDDPVALASWRMLRDHGAKLVYPGHGPVHPLRI